MLLPHRTKSCWVPAGGRRLNDLHVLDLATWTWYVPRQEGAALPAPREQAAAAFAPDGRLLLFGGRTNGARLNGGCRRTQQHHLTVATLRIFL